MSSTLILDGEVFDISSGVLETLDEIGYSINCTTRADVLQQAITLLYLLSRERHEKQVKTFMHYPNGGMKLLQFWKNASQPKLHAVGSIPDVASNETVTHSEFEDYRVPMKTWQENRFGVLGQYIGRPAANN